MAERTPPRPDYDYDVNRLVAFFETSIIQTRELLDSLYRQDNLTRAILTSHQAQLDAIIKQLREEGFKWSESAITNATLNGVADSLYSLGLAKTYDEARSIAKLSAVNQAYLTAQIADTQSDILAVTQNVDRQTRALISRIYAEQLRAQLSTGSNSIRQTKSAVSANLQRELKGRANTAIVDAVGRRWKVRDYVDMLAQTKAMQAHREASRNTALEEGARYGRVSSHGAKDACKGYEGAIVKLTPDAPGDYPYIDDLPTREIFHPRCRHIVTPIILPTEE